MYLLTGYMGLLQPCSLIITPVSSKFPRIYSSLKGLKKVEIHPAKSTLAAYPFLVFKRCNGFNDALKPAVYTHRLEISVVYV